MTFLIVEGRYIICKFQRESFKSYLGLLGILKLDVNTYLVLQFLHTNVHYIVESIIRRLLKLGLLQNAKCNVNPGLSYFEQCSIAWACLLASLHLYFAFRQSKATLPTTLKYFCHLHYFSHFNVL